MRTIGLLITASLAALAMLASGCLNRTTGQLGHASFSYEQCGFGCDVSDNALAAGGAHASISVNLDPGYRFTQARSTNSSVATFTVASSGEVDVVSGAPGTTQLQLIDDGGHLVDQVTVTVAATARLAYSNAAPGGAVHVMQGATESFHVTTEDAHGKTTIGTGSVTFAFQGPLHAAIALVAGDTQAFSGDTPGAAVVTASVGGVQPKVSASLPVQIVAPADIVRLDAVVQPNSVDGADVYANVDVIASDAAGAVYGASCQW